MFKVINTWYVFDSLLLVMYMCSIHIQFFRTLVWWFVIDLNIRKFIRKACLLYRRLFPNLKLTCCVQRHVFLQIVGNDTTKCCSLRRWNMKFAGAEACECEDDSAQRAGMSLRMQTQIRISNNGTCMRRRSSGCCLCFGTVDLWCICPHIRCMSSVFLVRRRLGTLRS